MIDNFPACLAFTLRFEGGFSDDPRDPGGRTNQGVTQRTFDAWRRRHDRPALDVRAMGAVERDGIYRDGYWHAIGADRLPAGVDLAAFDFAVNSGPARARKALAAPGGPDAAALVKRLCARRLSTLHALRTFRIFGRGWTARVMACEALGVRMAEQQRIGRPPEAVPEPQVVSRLGAEARAAAATARRQGRRAGATAAGGIVAAPAASATTMSLPAGAAVVVVVVVACAAAWLAFMAYRARLRAEAYATLAG